MKSQRIQSWVSRVRRSPPAAVEVADIPVGLVVEEPEPVIENGERQDRIRRTLVIIALVVFAPIIVIVILKVLRDVRSNSR
jgi:hypothetical protein